MTKSRRGFVGAAARLGISMFSLKFVAAGREQPDPFDPLPASAWKNSRNNGLIMMHCPAPAQISRRAQIASNNEPGKRLMVHGRVFGPDARTPLEEITVYAYNTDAAGYYGSDHKEYPPRLYGWMRTDADGRFELHTIFPGHYPGMYVPAHVHFTLWGRNCPPQWAEELRFQGDPYISNEMLTNAAEQGEFSSIQPLTAAKHRVLECSYNIRISRETNFR